MTRPAEGATFLALDLGTTFFKGAVLDLARRRLGPVERAPAPRPPAGLPPGHHELDPRAVVLTAQRLLQRLRRRAPRAQGLVVSGQMHGLVLTDPAGTPLSNLVTWQDARAAAPHPCGEGTYLDLLRRRVDPNAERATGRELWAGRPVSVLFWLAESGRLPTDAVPLSLPDFVLARLAGTPPTTLGLTQAASFGALDLRTLDWHRSLLRELRLEHLRWPRPVEPTEVVARLGAGSRSFPAYAPSGDQQVALLGAGLGPNELSLNVATGCQVSRLSPTLVLRDHQTRPYFDRRWLATVIHVPAGRSLQALLRLLTELATAEGVRLRRPWATLEREAAAVAATDLRVDLAFFPSATGTRGAITNVREETLSVGHLFRAALEAIVRGLRDAAARVEPPEVAAEIRLPARAGPPGVVLSGGLVHQSPLLRRLIAEAFPGPQRLGPREDALTGLLRVALVADRHVASFSEAVAATPPADTLP